MKKVSGSFTAWAVTVAVSAMLSGCAGLKTTPPETNPTDTPRGPGLISGKSGNLLDTVRPKPDQAPARLGVNIYLWRAALASVDFMPLISADSNGGVILTDWYAAPAAPSERAKLNIVITGRTIAADGLKVTLFKQQLDHGAWKTVAVNPATERALEEAIITKARALKVQAEAEK